ncbi:unnamed protein product [Adineta steineri]|uniref:Peptidase C14 caspase domain-containing protein n=1 Tax=Adineta steineri TaxID=433720 RepID=A0A815QBK5_9BILA|nr:unnamed protein product [Adineta steineri]CAF1633388.1 unnamed protein product [Adineta steineri]
MQIAINKLCATINDGDCVLIYFSGHGMEEKGQTYLIPIEDIHNPALNCICLDKLLNQLNNCGDKLLNIVILDSCRADEKNNTWKSKATSAENEDDLKFAFDEVLSKNVRRKNDSQFFVIYSADPGTVSYAAGPHTNGNSYFTHSLLNHISTPDMKLEEMMKEVSREIMLKSNYEQRPWIHSCLHEHFFFKKGEIQTKTTELQLIESTVAGGNENGDKPNQLNGPQGIFIDNDKSVYIADCWNHRIVKWELDSNTGERIVGRNKKGNQDNQLYWPKDIIFDKENKSFIIADYGNKRVIRYFGNNQTKQQIIISNIDCCSLTIDKNGFIYVCDDQKHEVKRYKQGDTEGVLVAGGNKKGSQLNQLHSPDNIFIDEYGSLYISDHCNQRVMKWKKDAKEGIVVAGGNGRGGSLKHLSSPSGVVVDRLGRIYVADCGNDRIVRWCKEGKEGEIVVGGNGPGKEQNQLNGPTGVSFDNEENLYVVDRNNHRIQKYETVLN